LAVSVKCRKRATAIGLSEAHKKGKKVPHKGEARKKDSSLRSMPREVELKLELAPEAMSRLQKAAWFRKFMPAGQQAQLDSVYFDTATSKLRRHGVSLRVRHCDGLHLQTIKTVAASALERKEWERRIRGQKPDLELARKTALEPLLGKKLKRKLKPVFETKVERTSIPVRRHGSKIEISLDKGQIKAGPRAKAISEIELELKSGAPEALARFAEEIADTVAVAYGAVSKAERGYALLNAKVQPSHAEDIVLDRTLDTATSFKTIAFSCLKQVVLNMDAVRKGNAEGVHQMRIGLRRLRAAISIFKEMLAGAQAEKVKIDLKWLTERLGPARDVEVFLQDTVTPLQSRMPNETSITALKNSFEYERSKDFHAAKRAIKSDRCRRTVLRTALWLLAGTWSTDSDLLRRSRRTRSAVAFAAEVLAKRSGKIVKRIDKLETLDAGQMHKLRIAVKKLRYGTDFFASLFEGKKACSRRKQFVECLKELQDALGEINDIRVHEHMAKEVVRHSARRTADGRERAYAIGIVTGSERAEVSTLCRTAIKAGRNLADAPNFWN
jgi:inorganic triphosphatase YgiF